MTRQTIVVVEDDPIQRISAVAAFAEAGFETADFDNTVEAAGFVQHNEDRILAVFTDVRMSDDMDGINLAAQMAVGYPRIALLVTSGQPDGVLERLPPNSSFLPKPWAVGDLVDVIGKIKDRQSAPAWA